MKPLAPADWAYFALDNVPYRGHLVGVLWDRDGTRYKRGKGLRVFANGKEIDASEKLAPLTAKLPVAPATPQSALTPVNFAVNNDGTYYPRVLASFSNPRTPPSKLIDGNFWYHRDPPNRWTCEGTRDNSDWVTIDFGTKRAMHTAKLYFLDDGSGVTPPYTFDLEHWDGKQWVAIPSQKRNLDRPTGHRANVVQFPAIEVTKVRAVFNHSRAGRTGLTEFEVWGDAKLPLAEPPHQAGNLAYNPGGKPFPKATASYADRFGGKPMSAIDGKVNFLPSPTNRWTSYESPNETDWLEVDFGS